jgi:hypothetical protein
VVSHNPLGWPEFVSAAKAGAASANSKPMAKAKERNMAIDPRDVFLFIEQGPLARARKGAKKYRRARGVNS